MGEPNRRSPSFNNARRCRAPDIVSEIRRRLQQQFSDFHKGVEERLRELLAPQVGTFWRETNDKVEGLAELERENLAKSTVTTLPDGFQEELLADIEEQLSRHCISDLVAMRDLFQVSHEEVEQAVIEAGGPPVVTHFEHLTDDKFRRVMETQLVFQREYRGELPRKGPFEYLMIARRYQMILFMMFSALVRTGYIGDKTDRRHG